MGLDILQFRREIVRPALTGVGLHSKAAENLIVGTAMVESRLQYVKQINGPAISIMQIEPSTYEDLHTRLYKHHKELYFKVLFYLNFSPGFAIRKDCDYLAGNLSAAVIFARLKYYFDPSPLPDANDYKGLAHYHKEIYNTALGHTDLTESTKIFRSVVKGYHYHG